MKTYRYTAKRKAREEIECLLSLGGGELRTGTFNGCRYWYEGAPDYCEREMMEAAKSAGLDYWNLRTCIEYHIGSAPKAPRGWVLLASFTSSGEAECWRCGPGTGSESVDPKCKLCDGNGLIYIGDGWSEVVYAHK